MLKSYLTPQHVNFWIGLTVLIGIALRTIQYLGTSSMWFDELTSALNIQTRTFYELATQSLDYNQVAPVGFLLSEKLASSILGESDEAYRFFPWLCSIASLILFVLVAKHFLNGLYLLAAVILFSGATSGIIYAGQAKQYAGDVTCTLFLVWATLLLMEPEFKKGRIWFFALGGSFAILSSLPAVPLAIFLLVILSVTYFEHPLPKKRYVFLIVGSLWLLAVLLHVCYTRFVISTTVKEAMTAYWSSGFPPLTSVGDYARWFPLKIYKELNNFLFLWGAELYPVLTFIGLVLLTLSIAGIVYLVRTKRVFTLILFAPLFIALVLAIAHVLPFRDRAGIYATWPFIISGIAGIASLQKWQPQIFRPALSTSLAFCIALPGILITLFVPSERPPFHSQASQPVLRELKKQMLPGDILYVYHKARHALKFYGPREGISNYRVANSYDSVIPYLREIDGLRGNKRVWFFYTQWTAKQPFPDSIKYYMGNVIGRQIGYIPDPYNGHLEGDEDTKASAYLYDLSGK